MVWHFVALSPLCLCAPLFLHQVTAWPRMWPYVPAFFLCFPVIFCSFSFTIFWILYLVSALSDFVCLFGLLYGFEVKSTVLSMSKVEINSTQSSSLTSIYYSLFFYKHWGGGGLEPVPEDTWWEVGYIKGPPKPWKKAAWGAWCFAPYRSFPVCLSL